MIGRLGKFGLNVVMVAAILVGGLMFVMFMASIIIPIFTTTSNSIGNTIQSTPAILNLASTPQVPDGNVSLSQSIDSVETATNQFNLFPYVLLSVAICAFIIFAINVRVHPVLLPLWIVLMFIVVMFSLPLTNTYQTLASANPTYFANQEPLTTFYMENLPVIFSVFGLLGGIFLFVLIQKEPEFETV